ncbi:uncharacterized protein A4U43_C07F26440 [Asparagus officinalis]|uniref:Uncharacterized protein n=1 Tax=Asparagus officinalis TaxID=4686 RepID=A0A5P1EFB9_ASPOF|nr:uncharacterized protein A4U43_C07F26440 [Asparagus officinalis]
MGEGRLWIHVASKVPELETIKAMEDFYREIYDVNGITDIKFPEYYPVSRLLAVRGLRQVEGPQPVKFPFPDPHNLSSLRPGALTSKFTVSRISAVAKPPRVDATIAGARAAATQFSKEDTVNLSFNHQINQIDTIQRDDSVGTSHNVSAAGTRTVFHIPNSQAY